MAINKINEFMKGKKLRTTYTNRHDLHKEVKFGGFSLRTAEDQPAYEGYLGIKVNLIIFLLI
jgi:hypothetical protein